MSAYKIRRAVCTLSRYCRGYRKIRQIPSFIHSVNVGNTLLTLGESNPDLIIAAYLHDTKEDNILTDDQIRKFGDSVYKLVSELTDSRELLLDKKNSWLQRKTEKLNKLNTTDSLHILLIAASDNLDNLKSLIADNTYTNGKIFQMLNGDKAAQRFYFTNAGYIFLNRSRDLKSDSLRTLAIEILQLSNNFFQ